MKAHPASNQHTFPGRPSLIVLPPPPSCCHPFFTPSTQIWTIFSFRHVYVTLILLHFIHLLTYTCRENIERLPDNNILLFGQWYRKRDKEGPPQLEDLRAFVMDRKAYWVSRPSPSPLLLDLSPDKLRASEVQMLR